MTCAWRLVVQRRQRNIGPLLEPRVLHHFFAHSLTHWKRHGVPEEDGLRDSGPSCNRGTVSRISSDSSDVSRSPAISGQLGPHLLHDLRLGTFHFHACGAIGFAAEQARRSVRTRGTLSAVSSTSASGMRLVQAA